MTKRKSSPNQPRHTDKVTLGKPDFEQALSFAEAMPLPAQAPDIAPPDIDIASLFAEMPVRPDVQPGQSAAALMPQDAATCKVLERRAQAIAAQASEQQDESHDQYLRFRLGAVERYGIPYQYLEELLYVGNLTRVPCTPAFIAGVVNHRGELLTILDLKQFFRMPAVTRGDEARIIVVKHNGIRAGLLVDEVDGNETYRNNALSSPLSSDGVSNMEHVLGIHGGSVTLLDMAAFLGDSTLQVAR
jgi:purine-binding chemotaxis protein CheW